MVSRAPPLMKGTLLTVEEQTELRERVRKYIDDSVRQGFGWPSTQEIARRFGAANGSVANWSSEKTSEAAEVALMLVAEGRPMFRIEEETGLSKREILRAMRHGPPGKKARRPKYVGTKPSRRTVVYQRIFLALKRLGWSAQRIADEHGMTHRQVESIMSCETAAKFDELIKKQKR